MKRISFLLVFLCTLSTYAQIDVQNNVVTGKVDTTREVQNITLKSRVRVPANAWIFNLGYNNPWITNSLTKNDFWKSKSGFGADFSVQYRKQFFKKVIENNDVITKPTVVGFGVGLGVTVFHKTAGFENYSETLPDFTDADNALCYISLTYKDVKEAFTLTYLDLPLYLEFGKLSRIKTSAYINLGVKASLLVSKTYKNNGIYTSTGYYEDTDVRLSDIPELNYFSGVLFYKNPQPDLSPFVLWGVISGGVNFPFSSIENNKIAKWILRISGKLEYSILPVNKALEETYFKGSALRINQINMLSNKSRIFTAGVTLSFIYCM